LDGGGRNYELEKKTPFSSKNEKSSNHHKTSFFFNPKLLNTLNIPKTLKNSRKTT